MIEYENNATCCGDAIYDLQPDSYIKNDGFYKKYLTLSQLLLKRFQGVKDIIGKLIIRFDWFDEELDVKQMEMRTKNEYNPKMRMPGL